MYAETDTRIWSYQNETMERVTEPNYNQGNSEGPQMHPHVGMKS